MKTRWIALGAGSTLLTVAGLADAHISVPSGPGFANATQEIAFGVGHGCNGDDTFRVVMDIPAGVTSVRRLRSDFGAVSVTKDTQGNVTTVTCHEPC